MPKLIQVRLHQVAHARSGDKGDASNVGLIADSPEIYRLIGEQVTPQRVKAHFGKVCRGEVERFPVPNLLAYNFILHDSLGGGGTESLINDAQGKTHAQGLLEMEVEVPEELVTREPVHPSPGKAAATAPGDSATEGGGGGQA